MDTQTPIDGDIWHDDLLNRKADAEFLHNFLTGKMAEREAKGISGSYVLNIDAEWGAGKSFFLKRFGQHLEQQGHLVVNIDAWRDDYVDDPFVAVLAAIDARLQPYYNDGKSQASTFIQNAKMYAAPIIVNTAKGMLKTVLKKTVGTEDLTDLLGIEDGSDVGDVVNTASEELLNGADKLTDQFTDNMIARFSEQENASVQFREQLAKALDTLRDSEQTNLPLFILIDELDRCRPTYAVALLERVKHLFDVNNVVFVFGTNSGQLQHSITGAYGPSFDGYRYLKRFFDKTYKLESSSIREFIEMKSKTMNLDHMHSPGRDSLAINTLSFFEACVRHYNLDLRDIEHVFDIIETASLAWPYQWPIELTVLFPLAVQYHRHGNADWQQAFNNISDDFYISLGASFNSSERKIYIKHVFDWFRRYSSSKKEIAVIFSYDEPTPDQHYIANYYDFEFNSLKNNDSSTLTKLPSLIMKAGQLN